MSLAFLIVLGCAAPLALMAWVYWREKKKRDAEWWRKYMSDLNSEEQRKS
jgi:cbb3-type cytochrome oxidase subunit 3